MNRRLKFWLEGAVELIVFVITLVTVVMLLITVDSLIN